MDWEQSDGVRWLGWTLFFAILLALGLGFLAHDLPAWLGAVAATSALATFVFPLLIGMLFPADNWRWGPCLSMMIAIIVLLVIPATGPREQTGLGLVTKKDGFIFILFWGGWWALPALSLLYVGIASVGTWLGGARTEQLAERNWEQDPSFRDMFSTNRSRGRDTH